MKEASSFFPTFTLSEFEFESLSKAGKGKRDPGLLYTFAKVYLLVSFPVKSKSNCYFLSVEPLRPLVQKLVGPLLSIKQAFSPFLVIRTVQWNEFILLRD